MDFSQSNERSNKKIVMEASTYLRPSWDEYFLGLMEEVGKRATCDRGRSGCIVVRGKQIVCTGYVGSPPGFPHCDDEGHLLKQVVEEDGSSPDALHENDSRRTECHLPGGEAWNFPGRMHPLLQDGTLPGLRDADHQCGDYQSGCP